MRMGSPERFSCWRRISQRISKFTDSNNVARPNTSYFVSHLCKFLEISRLFYLFLIVMHHVHEFRPDARAKSNEHRGAITQLVAYLARAQQDWSGQPLSQLSVVRNACFALPCTEVLSNFRAAHTSRQASNRLHSAPYWTHSSCVTSRVVESQSSNAKS